MDELIEEYARRAEKIYEERLAGDFTWQGLLASFMMEARDRGLAEVRPS